MSHSRSRRCCASSRWSSSRRSRPCHENNKLVCCCLVAALVLQQNVVVLALTIIERAPTKVLVTGASGRTGQLVFESLLEDDRFEPRALVRSEKSAKKLRKRVPATGLDQIIVCDIVTSLCSGNDDDKTTTTTKKSGTDFVPGMDGVEKMIICSSSVPQISKLSLLKAAVKTPWNVIRGKKAVDFRSLRFRWKHGQYPEKVDYQGQVALVDLARQHNMKQVVVVGSMGGTDPRNFLNKVGKNLDGTGHGDILLWKRKGEQYLVQSGLAYTIIHPGGLTDEPPGQEEFVLDVDDTLFGRTKRLISRADVANLCVAALVQCDGQHIALDCVTQPRSSAKSSSSSLTQPIPTAPQALEAFLQQGKEYHYGDY